MMYILLEASFHLHDSSNFYISNNIKNSYLLSGKKCHILRENDSWDYLKTIKENVTFVLFDNFCSIPLVLTKLQSEFRSLMVSSNFDLYVYGNTFYKIHISENGWKLLDGLNIHFFFLGQSQLRQSDQLFTHECKSVYEYNIADDFKNIALTTQRSPLRKWVYAGRISYQKNVHVLIKAFAHSLDLNPDQHLKIIGAFDDIGNLIVDTFHPGYYQKYLLTLLQSLPEKVRSKICFEKPLMRNELLIELQNSDVVANLSSFESEVLSLSMLEAHFLNKFTLRSNWGGVVEGLDDKSIVIPVTQSKLGFGVNEEKLLDGLALFEERLIRPKKLPLANLVASKQYMQFQSLGLESAIFFKKTSDFVKNGIKYKDFINPAL